MYRHLLWPMVMICFSIPLLKCCCKQDCSLTIWWTELWIGQKICLNLATALLSQMRLLKIAWKTLSWQTWMLRAIRNGIRNPPLSHRMTWAQPKPPHQTHQWHAWWTPLSRGACSIWATQLSRTKKRQQQVAHRVQDWGVCVWKTPFQKTSNKCVTQLFLTHPTG